MAPNPLKFEKDRLAGVPSGPPSGNTRSKGRSQAPPTSTTAGPSDTISEKPNMSDVTNSQTDTTVPQAAFSGPQPHSTVGSPPGNLAAPGNPAPPETPTASGNPAETETSDLGTATQAEKETTPPPDYQKALPVDAMDIDGNDGENTENGGKGGPLHSSRKRKKLGAETDGDGSSTTPFFASPGSRTDTEGRADDEERAYTASTLYPGTFSVKGPSTGKLEVWYERFGRSYGLRRVNSNSKKGEMHLYEITPLRGNTESNTALEVGVLDKGATIEEQRFGLKHSFSDLRCDEIKFVAIACKRVVQVGRMNRPPTLVSFQLKSHLDLGKADDTYKVETYYAFKSSFSPEVSRSLNDTIDLVRAESGLPRLSMPDRREIRRQQMEDAADEPERANEQEKQGSAQDAITSSSARQAPIRGGPVHAEVPISIPNTKGDFGKQSPDSAQASQEQMAQIMQMMMPMIQNLMKQMSYQPAATNSGGIAYD